MVEVAAKPLRNFTLYTLHFTFVFAAALSGVAKTFDVDVSSGKPAASNGAYYHGETIDFRAVRGRSVVTNIEYGCIYYQTNGMGDAWWKTDGLVFHPTNDVGASSYRFFLEGRDDLSRDWHANGLLRLLDSPGFEPNALPLPVRTLDFAAIDVVNAPWGDGLTTNDVCAIVTNEVPCEFSAWSYERADGLPYPVEVIAEAKYQQGSWIAYLDQERVVDPEAPPYATTLHLRGFYEADYYIATRSVLATRNALGLARVEDIEDIATNAAIEATSAIFRPFGDEYVYESAGYSDFAWSSDRADILAAIGSTQPYVGYEDGDYVEWHIDFYIGPTNYWGSAWAPANQPQVEFYVNGWYWDESTYEEHYDDATIVGSRTSQGYVRTNPVDTFAHQSELTTVRSELTSLQTLYNGETKVMRTGKAGELGTGWGYVQHRLDSETRFWRIRVPRWTDISGMATNNGTAGTSYYLADQPADGTPHTMQYPVITGNMLSYYPQWDIRRRLHSTRGTYGSDAVAMADWDVGIFLASTNGTDRCLANFLVEHTSTSPMSYAVTPSSAGTVPFYVGNTLWYWRDLDLPTFTRTWNLQYNRAVTVTADIKAILLESTAAVSTNGTFDLTFWTVSDQAIDIPGVDFHVELSDIKVPHTVTVTCSSSSDLENVNAPYYKVLSTADANLYYDAALDETFRISCSNGVFFSEWYMDGDWRKEVP